MCYKHGISIGDGFKYCTRLFYKHNEAALCKRKHITMIFYHNQKYIVFVYAGRGRTLDDEGIT